MFKNNDINSLVEKINIALSNEDIELRKKEKKICYTNAQDVIFKQWKDFIKKCSYTKER